MLPPLVDRPEDNLGYEMAAIEASKTVRLKSENFSETFDYVLVFPMDKDEASGKYSQSPVAKHCLHAMLDAGLEIYPYLSIQGDELYVLFRSPETAEGHTVLAEFADKLDYEMKCDPQMIRQALEEDGPEGSEIMQWRDKHEINPVFINHLEEVTPYEPWSHIFLKYDTKESFQRLYTGELTEHGTINPFVKGLRLKLLYLLLQAPKSQGGCDIQLSKLLLKKKILAIYPLHNSEEGDELLERIWDKKTFPWDVDIEDVRSYFGEKIGLFFVFLAHYSFWLIWPSIIGLAFQCVVWGTGNYSHPVIPFFSVLITLWSILMLEYWKRAEATVALKWGMTNFERTESERPEFKGDEIKSYITGRPMLYFHSSIESRRHALSQTVVGTFIFLVLGIVTGIYTLRFSLQPSIGSNASIVASVLNTIQIQVINMIYQVVAVKLTNRENHKTDTEYEDAMISKLFVFQFINSYSSFFFLAFIAAFLDKPDFDDDNAASDVQGQCGAPNCMAPLSLNLAIIFGSRLVVGNFMDVFLPYMMNTLKRRKETADTDENIKLTPAEEDYMLMQYVSILESIKNYADIAIQYGFTLLFVAALPIACGASVISNYAKTKFTAWKLVKFYQRPIPNSAQDIGTWQSIFAIISVVAVITNGALISFTMDVLSRYSDQGRVWFFIGFQWTLIGCQFIAQAVVDDVPEEVEIQIERQEFIKSIVIDHVADEDYEIDKKARLEELAAGPKKEAAITVASGCCGGGIQGESKMKMMDAAKDLTDLPEYSYPFDTIPSAFPKPYHTGGSLPSPPGGGGDGPAPALPSSSLSGAGVMPPPPPAYN